MMNIAASNEDSFQHPVIFFDGVCNLCNTFIDFIIRRDISGVFRFASLQSDLGRECAVRCSNLPSGIDSVILVEGEKCYTRSTAALHILRRLHFPWSLAYILIIFPKALRDIVYDYIARNRYRWFGKRDTCRLPTAEERTRFLD